MFPVKLERPLIIFDIESTGLSPRADRIIELAAIRVAPDGTETSGYWLLNPEVPIPTETTAIHGISDEIVKNCPTFKEKALEILTFFGDGDLAGFNAGRFDIPMLSEEFLRAEVPFNLQERCLLDAQQIFHAREPRDLSAALRFYCGRPHDGAHGAEADVRATLDVLRQQFEHYPDLPRTIEELDNHFNPRDPFNADRNGRLRWVNGELTINFGKKKGSLVRDLVRDDPGFLKWIIKNDFPQDTRSICENALKHIFPEPPRLKSDK